MKQETLEVKDYFNLIKNRFKLIILVTLSITAICAYITFFHLTPMYQAKTQILIIDNTAKKTETKAPASKPKTSTDANSKKVIVEKELVPQPNIEYQRNFVKTYIDMIQSPRILEDVNKKIAENGHKAIKEENYKIEHSEESQVITVLVKDPDPVKSALAAETLATTFQEETEKIMAIKNVQILMNAKTDSTPVWPIPWLNIGISFILGLILSFWIAFILENLKDTKIQ